MANNFAIREGSGGSGPCYGGRYCTSAQCLDPLRVDAQFAGQIPAQVLQQSDLQQGLASGDTLQFVRLDDLAGDFGVGKNRGTARGLPRYNQWFNQRLLDACERLTDAQRKEDRGAFFGSIHHTLNHLLVGDQVWLKRFDQCGVDHGWEAVSLGGDVLSLPPGTTLKSVLFQDWAMLRAKRVQLDSAIVKWAADLPHGFAQFTMRYANSIGVQREHPAWQAMTHFFNHQTHHRGQVTALLMQAGVDPGVTDLIALV